MTRLLSNVCRRAMFGVFGFVVSASIVAAQTTVTLNESKAQVVYATLRAGAYANKNYPTTLTTRAADTADNHRQALLKFDTQNAVPAGAVVTSAVMTLTVKGGSTASRTIGAYQVTTSWTEDETTWNVRRIGQNWISSGGDL